LTVASNISIKGKSIIQKHPAHVYALDVLSGKIPACKTVHQACQRYLNDLVTAHENGWTFDYREADEVIQWFPKWLKHSKGEYSGKPFHLLPWQKFIVWNLFGFKKKNGARRFSNGYITIPKKNGKTTFASGIMLYMLLADGEDSPEVYCAATHRDQAKIAFNECSRMATSSPSIRNITKQVRNNLSCAANWGVIVPLSSEANSSDGLNVSCGVIDEYHAHATSEVYDIVKSGTIARRQPIFLTITTAGFTLNGPCHKLHNICKQILNGQIEDSSTFTIIYSIDESETDNPDDGDNWMSEAVWEKANPSLGHGVTLERLREEFKQAKNEGGTKITNFKTKFLNVWVGSSRTWIPDEVVKSRMVEEDPDLRGISCYGGLDLANTRDIVAFSLKWELDNERSHYCTWFWLPEQRLLELSTVNDKHPYIQFAREGFITVTPGNVVNYDFVRRVITGYYIDNGTEQFDNNCLARQYAIHSIAFDRWNSSQFITDIETDGMRTMPFGQGFKDLSFPTKELETSIHNESGVVTISSNPVTRWMFGNVAMMTDPAGNIKPDKARSQEKIDGIVSMIMANGCSMHGKAESKNQMPANWQMKLL
jgi:phage terminase large subunit-like protein